ncbi:hypothetical protein GCM10025867_36240 [Frondihabitans sucicola]|uniref:Uncharacterized protein n=1 Tax=Frondihabitans sucicola TaxID=1268041 RepID=A0ABN6Y759_9MICO|nr:hypothetical protein GCM10025867_36240 [Frondihabitans sucicola]
MLPTAKTGRIRDRRVVVAGVIDASRITDSVVMAALAGAIGLLFGRIWRRFGPRRPPTDDSGRTGG